MIKPIRLRPEFVNLQTFFLILRFFTISSLHIRKQIWSAQHSLPGDMISHLKRTLIMSPHLQIIMHCAVCKIHPNFGVPFKPLPRFKQFPRHLRFIKLPIGYFIFFALFILLTITRHVVCKQMIRLSKSLFGV